MNKGFTLIELAIVLVIMGLMVGGVLAGRDLIEQTAIRNTLKKLKDYDTALIMFQSKYNCLPGDCAKANAFGLTANSAFGADADGNGNGTNYLDSVSGYFDGEMTNFWIHLSNSGLLKESYQQEVPNCDSSTPCGSTAGSAFPSAGVGNGIAAFSDSPIGKTYFLLGTAKTLGLIEATAGIEDSISANSLTPVQSYIMDKKIDDGRPRLGKMRVYSYLWPFPELIDDESNADTEDCYSSDAYNINVSAYTCSLKMETSNTK